MADRILGTRIRDYILIEKIGRGNFGIVFKAKKDSGRKKDPVEYVAIKRLEIMKNRKHTKRELQIADHLSDHEHLISMLGYFFAVDKPRVYLVMEYCDGGNLNNHIIKDNPDLETQMLYMLQIAKAVSHLHYNNVIHRDIKPENILLVKEGAGFKCKLGDFSVSRLLTESKVCDTVCGTFLFVAPEVLDAKGYTYSADVFSLGTLYFVMHTRYVDQDGDKAILAPYVKSEGHQMLLSAWIRRGKMSKSALTQNYFSEFSQLGDVVYHMLQDEPKKRPDMISVMANIAELKGSLKPSGAQLVRKSKETSSKEAQGWGKRGIPRQYMDSGLSTMEDEVEDGEIKVLSANQIEDDED